MEDCGGAPVEIAEGEREVDSGVGAGGEQMDESDVKHEDLPVDAESWPGRVEDRMNLLQDVL
jgi:hypothetical protein